MCDSWDECFEAALKIAKNAGAIVLEAYNAEKQIVTKTTFADLVTETDEKVEKMIIDSLKSLYPTHSFIGEESVSSGAHCELTNNPTWIIDPVDGTNNFVHRFPVLCVSIALVVEKKAVLGIVYNPIMAEMFTAQIGKGAYLNDKKIFCTKVEELNQALVCAEFGSSRAPDELDAKFATMRNVIQCVHGIRSLGSAAANMCSIAAGRADAYWEFGMHAWDIAAGELIVREAGGVVMNTTGGPLDIMDRRVLCAGTEKLALELSKHIVQISLQRD